MSSREPMPKPGNPLSPDCRHCGAKRVVVNTALFCTVCDSPKSPELGRVRPTWAGGGCG